MSHGLHKISHFLVADGSGRDNMIFLDRSWKYGRLQGYGNPATLDKQPAIIADERATDVYGMKPRGAIGLSEAKRRMQTATHPEDYGKAAYRLKGGIILHLPKVAAKDQAAKDGPGRSQSVPALQSSKKKQGAKHSFRSRDMESSFDSWSTQRQARMQGRPA
eukprot:TRINITY_DN107235_c0_g1_i1.p1 TRINITY_DN107235_c0_g1~~TRINITY_DN107235_c0_g1_i1.p1  ORF type:complete len:162 (-),score=27.44 TRINITY_DN107235_c0_g1_i1:258-743(-)